MIDKVEELVSILVGERHIARKGKLLVAMDYDGTLVPFAPQPEQAIPGLRLLDVLNRLVGRSDLVIAIVSGRTLAELERLINLQPVWLAALHGAVIKPPGKSSEWLIEPECYSLLKKHIRDINMRLFYNHQLPQGFWVENKGLSIAIHYRGVPEDQVREGLLQLLPAMDSLMDKSLFGLLHGAKVVEIRPLTVNKGKAVKYIADSNRDCFPVYLGDDITDEDAFKALGEGGCTIRVSNDNRPTAAKWRLPTPDAALDFLDTLIGAMDRMKIAGKHYFRY